MGKCGLRSLVVTLSGLLDKFIVLVIIVLVFIVALREDTKDLTDSAVSRHVVLELCSTFWNDIVLIQNAF